MAERAIARLNIELVANASRINEVLFAPIENDHVHYLSDLHVGNADPDRFTSLVDDVTCPTCLRDPSKCTATGVTL
jgi:hypothetical protein